LSSDEGDEAVDGGFIAWVALVGELSLEQVGGGGMQVLAVLWCQVETEGVEVELAGIGIMTCASACGKGAVGIGVGVGGVTGIIGSLCGCMLCRRFMKD
jgi:hypothetical protein